jgi:ribosomal protein S18
MARDGESRSFRRKFCKLCLDKVERIDYKDDRRLSRFITDRGKIGDLRAASVPDHRGREAGAHSGAPSVHDRPVPVNR